MCGSLSTRLISGGIGSLQKSETEGEEEIGGNPIRILGRKELKSHFYLHFAKGEVLRQQPQSVRAAGVCSCGQAALIQLSADLSLHPKALNQHPSQGVLQARTNHSLSRPLSEQFPPSPALPLACALRRALSSPPPMVIALLLPHHQI